MTSDGPETRRCIIENMTLRAIAAPLLILVVIGCSGAQTDEAPDVTPTPVPILQPGQTAANDCERAVLAHHAHPSLDDEAGRLEAVVFDTCTFAEFSAFNRKVTEPYKYPEDGAGYVDRNCTRTLSAYSGSQLCETAK
jgi:hypothetical protein